MPNLLDFYVTLKARGKEQVQGEVADLQAKLKNSRLGAEINVKGIADLAGAGRPLVLVLQQFNALNEQMGKQAEAARKLSDRWRTLNAAFSTAGGIVGGFVRQGLAGTTMGERLNLQFQLLSREIANMFIPVLQKIVGVLQHVTTWFRSLSGPQQEMIGNVLALAVAARVLAPALTTVTTLLKGVGAALAILQAHPLVAIATAIAGLITLTGTWGDVLETVGAVFGRIGGFLSDLDERLTGGAVGRFLSGAWERVRDFLGLGGGQRREGSDRHELANVTRGPESFAASFTRFQTAALRTGQGNAPERTATATERTAAAVERLAGARPAPPAVD